MSDSENTMAYMQRLEQENAKLCLRLTRLEAAARYTVRKMHDSTIVYDMTKCCKRLEQAMTTAPQDTP